MNAKPLSPKELAGFLFISLWGMGIDTLMVATDALRWLHRRIS